MRVKTNGGPKGSLDLHCFHFMDLTQADLDAFKAIWKREFNEELTDDEARHEAQQLLELYGAIADGLCRERPNEEP